MTVQEIIQKIEDAEIRERSRRLVVTEPLLKFEMINYLSDSFDKDDSTLNKDGYYAMMGGVPTFINTTNWVTFTMPIASTESAIAKFIRFSLNGGELFVITKTDDTKEYVNVPNTVNNPIDFSIQLPENTQYIEVSYLLQPSPTPIQIVFEIEVERFQYVNITPYVSNWPTVDMTQERNGFSGVTLEVTNQIEVSGLAADIMKTLVEEKSLYARVGFNIYKRQKKNNNYDLLRGFEVDFLTYVEYDDHVEFQAIKNDLQEYVKSGLSTKFDFPVSSLTDAKKWDYERMVLLNSINYTMPVGDPINNPIEDDFLDMYFPISYSNAELVPNENNATLDFTSQSFTQYISADPKYLFKTGFDITMNLKLKAQVSLGVRNASSGTDYRNFSLEILIIRGGSLIPLWSSNVISIPKGNSNVNFDIDINQEITLNAGDSILMKTTAQFPVHVFWIQYNEFNYFNLQWTDRGESINGIDLIRPERLLRRFLDSISGVINKFTANIEWSELSTIMLCAGETIRGFENAILHGSLRDFISWMAVLGYQYSYEGNAMTFRFTPEYYKKDIVSMELSEDEVSNMRIEANDEVAYTSIEIGYKKEDYNESTNGKLEVNTQFNYSTGYRNQTENVLSLLSPYRSDSIGAELLFWKRGENIKDNSSDNDIFALEMFETDTNFEYSTLYTIGTEFPDIILYNALLNPHYLVTRNRFIIGIITNSVQFTATDGYRNATINDDDIMYSNVDINPLQKLYEPLNYRLDVGSHLDMPMGNAMNGLIYFDYKGTTRKGFIQEITKECQEKQGEWLLSMVK